MDVSACALQCAEARLGLAAKGHGSSCLTVDFDIVARVTGWDVQRLVSAAN